MKVLGTYSHENTQLAKMLTPTNLDIAYKRVKANKGSAGIDGMTIEDFPAFAQAKLGKHQATHDSRNLTSHGVEHYQSTFYWLLLSIIFLNKHDG